MKVIGNFFVRIGQWIKNTAWIQIIGLVGIVVGIIIAAPYAIRGIQGWVATWDNSTFYQDHRINYEKYQQVISDDKTSIIFFYEESCVNCESTQKHIEDFYKQYHDLEGTKFDFYSINVAWKDEANDNDITKDQLEAAGEDLFNLYKSQTDLKILGQYTDMNNTQVTGLADPYDFPTPTILLVQDGGLKSIRLGYDQNTLDGVYENLYYMLTGTEF